jgi:menaquinone-dependent protoporphyrinogen oxidase
MSSILVTYASNQGQTATVAAFVAGSLETRGHAVTLHSLDAGPVPDPAGYDAVVVGSPVNDRRHLPAVVRFAREHRDALAARPSAFFQLSLATVAGGRLGARTEREWVAAFTEETGWEPDTVGSFAGAVAYTRYGPVARQLFRLVGALTTGDTDTTRDYVYTDWTAVAAFADEVGALVGTADPRPGDGGGRTRVLATRRAAVVGLLAGAAAVALAAVLRRRVRRRAGTDDRDPRAVPVTVDR